MTLATCSKDLKLYTWPGLTLTGFYESPPDDECGGTIMMRSISWSGDGKSLMAVNGKDHPFLFTCPFQPDKKIEPSNVLTNVLPPSCGVFSNSSCSSVAFGDSDGSVYIYDLKKRRKVNQYESVPASVAHIDFSSQDTCLAVGCANGQVILYAATAQPCASYVVPHSRTLSVMRFSKFQQDVLAAATKEGVVSVWNASKGASLIVGRDHVGAVTDLDFSGETVSTVGADGKMISYDLRAGDYQTCYNLSAPLSCVAFGANAHELAVGTIDGHVRSYDRRFMTSPTNTVVAYESPVKIMTFRPLTVTPVSSRPLTKENEFVAEANKDGRYKNNASEAANAAAAAAAAATVAAAMMTKQTPASAGDYNPDLSPSSSTLMSLNQELKMLENIYLHETLPMSVSQIAIEPTKNPQEELSRFRNDINDALKRHKRKCEENMLAEFYRMRIEISRQFIELQDMIGSNWEGLVAYFKDNMKTENDDEVEEKSVRGRHSRRNNEEEGTSTISKIKKTMNEEKVAEVSEVVSEAKTYKNISDKVSEAHNVNVKSKRK